MERLKTTASSGSVQDLQKYLQELGQPRSRDHLSYKYGTEKGSIIHMVINRHLQQKADIAIDKLELLLKHGASLEQRDIYGNNALMHSAKLGKHTLTECIIQKSKIPLLMESNHYGMNLLHIASLRGHWHVLDLVLQKVGQEKLQSLLNQPTSKPFTRYIPSAGKTLSIKAWTPLHFSAMCCHLDCLKWLVKHGADKKAGNAERLTPGEMLQRFSIVEESTAIAKQCYGYIVARKKNTKAEEEYLSTKQPAQVVNTRADTKPTISRSQSMEKNQLHSGKSPVTKSKIIVELDEYLSSYGMQFKDIAKKLIEREISNVSQLGTASEKVPNNQEPKYSPNEAETGKSTSGRFATTSTHQGTVREIQDKDLAFVRNVLGDYLNDHNVDYEYLLSAIKARFVVAVHSDSDTDSETDTDGYDDDFEESSSDEEEGYVHPKASASKGRQFKSGRYDVSEEDDSPVEEYVISESVEEFTAPVPNFGQKQRKTGEMVSKPERKKAMAVYPSDATIRDIAMEIPTAQLTKFGRSLGFAANEVACIEQGRETRTKAKALLIKWRDKQVQGRVEVIRIRDRLDETLKKLDIDHLFED